MQAAVGIDYAVADHHAAGAKFRGEQFDEDAGRVLDRALEVERRRRHHRRRLRGYPRLGDGVEPLDARLLD